jgi:hypothetical protein
MNPPGLSWRVFWWPRAAEPSGFGEQRFRHSTIDSRATKLRYWVAGSGVTAATISMIVRGRKATPMTPLG